MKTVLSVFGTRPEAIKMAPLIMALENDPDVNSVVCITGQHREMLQQVMDVFQLSAQYDLGVMVPDQTLNGLFGRLLDRFDAVLEVVSADCVLVHGDTTTAAACALAAFHRKVAVGHVEAGLRSHDMHQPFPEEMNRRLIDTISAWHFAPTIYSRLNLQQEKLYGTTVITGNTVIDALLIADQRLERDADLAEEIRQRYAWINPRKRMILVTGHRRENMGEGFRNICLALAQLAGRSDVQIVYPVHLNPRVREVVMAELGDLPSVHLIEPLDYLEFIWFMKRSAIVLTDSGGVQEEAPSLGKPVLVMREVTERPEAMAAGTSMLVGTDPDRIVAAVTQLLDDDDVYGAVSQRSNPYGDGQASQRIVDALMGRPVSEFMPQYPDGVMADEYVASSL